MADFLAEKLVPEYGINVNPFQVRFGASTYNGVDYNDVPLGAFTTTTDIREQIDQWQCKNGTTNPNALVSLLLYNLACRFS